MAKQCTVTSIRGERVATIAAYMRSHLDNARDSANIVDLTALAEQAAASYDLYNKDGSIPESLFDLAYDVANAAGELE